MTPLASLAHTERSSTVARDIYDMLRSEMQQALLHDPARKVRTPAWGLRRTEVPAADVVYDSFSDKDGDARLHDVLSIIGAVARGEDMQVRAQLLLSVASAQYAASQVEFMDIES